MAIDAAALERARELFAFLPALSLRKMFGGFGVYSDGLIFAIGDGQEVYLKADDQTEPLFRAAGSGPFVYAVEDGRELTVRYFRLPEEAWEDPDALRRWTGLAMDAALRARAGKKLKAVKAKPTELLITGPWDDQA